MALFSFLSIGGLATAAPAFLYEISKGQAKSFLFGSVHAGVSLGEVPSSVLNALASSQVVFAEQIWSPNVVSLMVHDRATGLLEMIRLKMLVVRGEALSDIYKTELVQNWGVPARVAEVATTKSCPLLLFTESQKLLDFEILDRAYRSSKNVVGLDQPVEKRWHFNFGLCDIRQAIVGQQPEQRRQTIRTLASVYRSGIETSIPSSPENEKSRNAGWVRVIEPVMTNQPVFISVGVGHLFGENGLLQMFRNQGYSVRRKN